MAIYGPTPGFKGRTFKLCVLTRWDFNFCIRSSPLRGTHRRNTHTHTYTHTRVRAHTHTHKRRVYNYYDSSCTQGTGLTASILCMELLPARHRFTQSVAGTFLWSFAMVVLAFVAFLMRHVSWRYLQLAFASSSLYCILQIWYTVLWTYVDGC